MAKVNLTSQEVVTVIMNKVKCGICCVPDCNGMTELQYASSDPPYLCGMHLSDTPEWTHAGDYVPIDSRDRSVSHQWTCCGSTWRLARCRKLSEFFASKTQEIPVTEFHLRNIAEKNEEARVANLERQRLEEIAMNNDTFAWDRS